MKEGQVVIVMRFEGRRERVSSVPLVSAVRVGHLDRWSALKDIVSAVAYTYVAERAQIRLPS